MINTITKYFAGELTPKEIESFLSEVNTNEKLRKEFIEMQQLLACVDIHYQEGNSPIASVNPF